MAAGAVASAVNKLSQLLQEEVSFLSVVGDDVEWLRAKLRYMQSFLKDADIKSRRGDERIKTWVNDVRDVAFKAEDVLDIFMLKIEKRRGVIAEFLRKYVCFPPDLIDLHDIGKQILQIKSKVHAINESRQAFGIVDLCAEKGDASVTESRLPGRQFSPHMDDDTVIIGFDASKNFILGHLLDSDVTKRRRVVSIVGMGGLGKTTLAAKVYNSDDVRSHFTSCVWITVSQTYSVGDLLKQLVKSVSELDLLEGMGEDQLKTKLYNALGKRRYLIVLDDIWEEAVWRGIKDAFPNSMNGSRVLITTRLMEVAKSADPSTAPYELPLLNPEHSWELFLRKVFPSDEEGGVVQSCPKDLEELGKEELVKRCGGLPLAVAVLGALLAKTEPTITAWRDVAESLDWRSTYDGSSLKILALSYHMLPHHYLKSCFLYLGCFPEDRVIKASDVIRLWIAEGFVNPQHRENHLLLEETAAGYLEELAQRCMVQVVKRGNTWKRVGSFRIHDLFREFCTSEAQEERFFRICSRYDDENASNYEITSSRRLVIHGGFARLQFCNSANKARTIVGSGFGDEAFSQDIFHGLNLLRVIYLEFPETSFSNILMKNISSLIHLRSLTLINNSVDYFPSSIGKLQNLQTLDMRDAHFFDGFPETLYKIQTLRHLVVKFFRVQPSSSIECLRNLQTLRCVNAGSWMGSDRLSKLSSLRELHICDVREEHMTALRDSLPNLKNLTSLKLSSDSETPLQAGSLFSASAAAAASPSHHHQHLYKLKVYGKWDHLSRCLPRNLINVRLHSMTLDRDMIAALERLPSLEILTFLFCEFEDYELVCSAGGFSRLRSFKINQMSRLTCWEIENGAMPNLLYLELSNCSNLRMAPEGLEHVASLQKLKINRVDKEFTRRLSVQEEDGHKIQHIPSVEVSGESGKLIAMKRSKSEALVFTEGYE